MYNQTDLRAAAARLLYSDNRDSSDYNLLIDFIDKTFKDKEELENLKPLTIDELRKMGGEPYYHVSLRGGEDHWAILDPLVANHIERCHYGERWLAYRIRLKKDVK